MCDILHQNSKWYTYTDVMCEIVQT